MKSRLRLVVTSLSVLATLGACETAPPGAPPRPPPKQEMEPVLPSWSNTMWVMGFWKWSGTEWVWIPGHLAPKP
ncbi:CDI system lipoprotein BcpO [Burkholderia singularis]|uniref:CDI system lipoprotein BcpO n=1 Tax=Burkholderia singularis TaxID=1503053 RepID=UPI0009E8E05F|nr:CDI system lipoprotein BcpO [Burkholderia singularis]